MRPSDERGGAPELTRFIFGRDGRAERRRFYHLASTGSLPAAIAERGPPARNRRRLDRQRSKSTVRAPLIAQIAPAYVRGRGRVNGRHWPPTTEAAS